MKSKNLSSRINKIVEAADEINYDLIMFKHDQISDELERAIDMVQKFIQTRELIMVGGQAIDMALRLCGKFLYDKDEIPDYDCYSPNHYSDAVDLGYILHNTGFRNVSVIRGLHETTMRVRVNFIAVADITFCPKSVYDSIITLNYKGLRVIHPHLQMIDQQIALSYPYRHPAFGGTFNRWNKDVTRFNMLYENFPIKTQPPDNVGKISGQISDLVGNCLIGYLAYSYYMGKFRTFKDNFSAEGNRIEILCDSDRDFPGVRYNAYMSVFPEFYRSGKIDRYVNRDFISAKPDDNELGFHVVTPHHLLAWFLHNQDLGRFREILDYINKNDCAPFTSFFGKENTSFSYIAMLQRFDEIETGLPADVFPHKKPRENIPDYDYKHEAFHVDGKKAL